MIFLLLICFIYFIFKCLDLIFELRTIVFIFVLFFRNFLCNDISLLDKCFTSFLIGHSIKFIHFTYLWALPWIICLIWCLNTIRYIYMISIFILQRLTFLWFVSIRFFPLIRFDFWLLVFWSFVPVFLLRYFVASGFLTFELCWILLFVVFSSATFLPWFNFGFLGDFAFFLG